MLDLRSFLGHLNSGHVKGATANHTTSSVQAHREVDRKDGFSRSIFVHFISFSCSQAYAKGMVIMKEPMPNFSTVFDRKPKQRKIGMSIHTAKHIHDIVSKAQDKRNVRLATLVGSSKGEVSRAASGGERGGADEGGSELKSEGGRAEAEVKSGGGGSEAGLNIQSRAKETGEVAEGTAMSRSSMSFDTGANLIVENPPMEPLAESTLGSGLVSESSLDLSEKLRRIAGSDNGSGAGLEASTSEDATTYSGESAETISGEGFDGEWRQSWERLLEGEGSESEGSDGEFAAEDKSDLELLDVLTANRRMKVNARVEGVSPGDAAKGRSRRVRRNAALQELAESVERKEGAFSDGETSDDDFVDKSRWRKVAGGPHDGVKNGARKSVRRALREAEQNAGGRTSVSGAPEREASVSAEAGSSGAAIVSSGARYGASTAADGREQVVQSGKDRLERGSSRAGGSIGNGLASSDGNSEASTRFQAGTELPFASDGGRAELSADERAFSENGAGPSSANGARNSSAWSGSGVRDSMRVDSAENWKQRDVNGWSKQSHVAERNGRRAEQRAAPIVEAGKTLLFWFCILYPIALGLSKKICTVLRFTSWTKRSAAGSRVRHADVT